MNISPEFDDAMRELRHGNKVRIIVSSNTSDSSSSTRDSVECGLHNSNYIIESPEQSAINKMRKDLEQVRDVDLGD